MATAGEILEVRENTNEPSDATFSDTYIEGLVDAGSVALASATIWRRKAAIYAELVDVSEAGASRKNSDLFKNAQTMADHWQAVADGEDSDGAGGGGRVRIHTIQRLE